MKQTAVEYIKEKLLSDEYWYENMTFEQIFEQAKAMEKEQNYNLDNLRDAYRWGTTVSIGTSEHFEEFVNNFKSE